MRAIEHCFSVKIEEGALKRDELFAYEKQREGIIEESLAKAKPGKVLAFVGPEGGFEEWEVKEACEAGFIAVTLGATKLRTETAGIVVLTRILAAA